VAITGLEFLVFSSLRQHDLLPKKPAVLELGESNWYGDVPIAELEKTIGEFVTDADQRASLLDRLNKAALAAPPQSLYEIARVFFAALTDYASYSSIDPGTPGSKYQFDLNHPVPLEEQFDLVINIGTAEHVFNVHQFFKTAHDLTKSGGMMIHSCPFTGWADHGFYTFQPTFFFDLARANRYTILSFICGQIHPPQWLQISSHDEISGLLKSGRIPKNSHINVVLRKADDPSDFAIPTQGYYAGVLSDELKKRWRELPV
jgi:SAM-dependent methyltransferase